MEEAVETGGWRGTKKFGESHNMRLEKDGGGQRKWEKAGEEGKRIEEGQRKPQKPEEAEEGQR